jgi:primase-polymerase (primpol)-like protein
MVAVHLRAGAAMTDKPRTYHGDLTQLPPALEPLAVEPRWVVWRWEPRTNKSGKLKWTKPPYRAREPSRTAESDKPSTWSSYTEAVATVQANEADGIGFMLAGSNIGAIDLDNCRDRESGAVDGWAESLQAEANGAYHEITVSGAGLRIIGRASGPNTQRRFNFNRRTGAGVEIFRNTNRYITVSALEIGSCAELPQLDEFLDRIPARRHARAPGAVGG